MAVASRGRGELASPERTKVWTEPKLRIGDRRVPVVYYLSRNGHLEHPHFIEVPLSSNQGLYLRDVISRLDFLRGKGMAGMYSWSSKRSYKNGFVWHDLTEDDFIYPAHGQEYVLKGSELLHSSEVTAASYSPSEIPKSLDHHPDFPLAAARIRAPSRSVDLTEYKVYKNDLTSDFAAKAANAATQTEDRRHRRRSLAGDEDPNPISEEENPTTELGRDEISPPPSSSSPETLESLIRTDGRLIAIRPDPTAGSGRNRASAVLLHLISCGSVSVKDGDFSMVSQYRSRLPRGPSDLVAAETPGFSTVRMEDKEYFSGSLIETKKKAADDGGAEFGELKRSSSYNADRSSKLELVEKEMEGVRARCIPRRPKPAARNPLISRTTTHGSKRIDHHEPC